MDALSQVLIRGSSSTIDLFVPLCFGLDSTSWLAVIVGQVDMVDGSGGEQVSVFSMLAKLEASDGVAQRSSAIYSLVVGEYEDESSRIESTRSGGHSAESVVSGRGVLQEVSELRYSCHYVVHRIDLQPTRRHGSVRRREGEGVIGEGGGSTLKRWCGLVGTSCALCPGMDHCELKT